MGNAKERERWILQIVFRITVRWNIASIIQPIRTIRRDLSHLIWTTNARACRKNWSLRVILRASPCPPPSPSRANREKNSIRSKGNRFCDKAEKLISQKRQFRKSARVPRYLYDNLSSSETSYHISLFRDASALIVIIVVIAANVTDVADYISDSIDLAFGGLKISRYLSVLRYRCIQTMHLLKAQWALSKVI